MGWANTKNSKCNGATYARCLSYDKVQYDYMSKKTKNIHTIYTLYTSNHFVCMVMKHMSPGLKTSFW